MSLNDLRPNSKQLIYDLVGQAGIDTSDWANFKGEHPSSNPKYCYNWSFRGADQIIACLWFDETLEENDTIYRKLNMREIAASPRQWNPTQCRRAAAMDQDIQLAWRKRLPVRIIIVDGSIRNGVDDETRSRVEERMLDPEPWHVAAYDDDGNCRLQRGPQPTAEKFTPEEVFLAGKITEGAESEATIKVRDRSVKLRDLARDYFGKRSLDGRLHCGVCNWSAPRHLDLSSPIVEIHHGIGISAYPAQGKTLTFEEAIQFLTPLCPNCHRTLHARKGGGTYRLEDLRAGIRQREHPLC